MPQILLFSISEAEGDDGGAGGAFIPGGRLTLATADPIPTSDQTAKTTVYYTPYLHGFIDLYFDGWRRTPFSEKSISVPSTTNTPFDVFGYLSAGELVLETVNWTNDTTRATDIVRHEGAWVKDNGVGTHLYLGTCRTTGSSGQCEDSANKRFVWNAYNRVQRRLFKNVSGSSYTYGTNAYRQANADTANQVDFVIGLTGHSFVELQYSTLLTSTFASPVANVGVGENVTNATSAFQIVTCLVTSGQFVVCTYKKGSLAAGRHFLAAIEKGAGSGVQTWTNDNIDRGLLGSINC